MLECTHTAHNTHTVLDMDLAEGLHNEVLVLWGNLQDVAYTREKGGRCL
jgi:hypothetical protein